MWTAGFARTVTIAPPTCAVRRFHQTNIELVQEPAHGPTDSESPMPSTDTAPSSLHRSPSATAEPDAMTEDIDTASQPPIDGTFSRLPPGHQSQASILTLPDDLLLELTYHLTPIDAFKLSLTCSRWHGLMVRHVTSIISRPTFAADPLTRFPWFTVRVTPIGETALKPVTSCSLPHPQQCVSFSASSKRSVITAASLFWCLASS